MRTDGYIPEILGTMDENGYFKITGRLKDMIIRGGENIYPREIEEFMYTHPQDQGCSGDRRAGQDGTARKCWPA